MLLIFQVEGMSVLAAELDAHHHHLNFFTSKQQGKMVVSEILQELCQEDRAESQLRRDERGHSNVISTGNCQSW